MLSLKQKQSGFTIVELLIVIVIIGILAGLVITTFVGIQARGRDSERQTDINAIQKQVEAYYAVNGAYPTAANINSSAWRTGNKVQLDAKALANPSNASTQTLSGTAPNSSDDPYGYVATPSGCEASTDNTGASVTPASPGACTGYTVSAWMEAKNEAYSQQNQ
ncbi:prepilin-type N-terminal cleavage/methylation domain-containing protein [Candidatus Saccharibacteria bacterium]|nr:MAG: prepilin-type N-terminal cleavage/methylation domain-containing protein [Candidatus Saccharibacteria bacterium]